MDCKVENETFPLISRLSLSKYHVLCHVNVRHLKSAVTCLISYHDPVEMCTVRHTVTQ